MSGDSITIITCNTSHIVCRYPATDVEIGDEQDVSPLHLACTYGHLDSVRYSERLVYMKVMKFSVE